MRKTSILLGILILISSGRVSCQSNQELFTLSKEKIEMKNSKLKQLSVNNRLDIIGKAKNHIVLEGINQELYLYDESIQEIKPYLTLLKINNSKAIRIIAQDDLLFQIGFFNLPDEYKNIPINKIPINQFEYQDFWIQYKNRNFKIDSFPYHYLDKYISCNFSENGKKLICNPYTIISAGYSPDIDNRIYVYELERIDNVDIKKNTLSCERCMNTFLINNTFYYQKEIPIGKGLDGYYKNIYKASINNINDTLLIAHDIVLKNITPDGAFILGEKYLYGRLTPVLINVQTKRYQYILGRKYPIENSYYSYQEEKFFFDFGEQLVYIEFPQEYPFDAIKNTSYQRTTKAENETFWKKYLHEPLKK
jgi:hypothetical protein